jgi:hypothetical protein
LVGVFQGTLFEHALFNIDVNDSSSLENDTYLSISVIADDANVNVLSGSIDIDGTCEIIVATGLSEQ